MRLLNQLKLSTLAAVAAAALGGVEAAHTQQTATGGDVVVKDSNATRTGEPTGTRVLRSWRDSVKVRGRDVPRRVEIVYDYDTGVGLRRVYDADDQLTSEEPLAVPPPASREEIAQAYAMIRGDAELGALARRAGAHLDGGFLLLEGEGEPCGPGSRCIQVPL